MKVLPVVLLTVAVLLSLGQAQIPAPVRTAGPAYEGTIISAEALAASDRSGSRNQAKAWTPSERDVREAETLLPAYLASHRGGSTLRDSRIPSQLSRYKRQYCGFGHGKRREILILFFHEDSSVVRKGLWLKGMVSAAGGGDQFFRVRYRVDERRFRGLAINARE